MEGAAFAGLAFHFDAPAHPLDQLTGDGGAQPGAAEAARHRGIGLRERLEDAFQPVGGDADAGVAHGQVHVAATAAGLQPHPAFLGELDGIADQVGQHLLHAQAVADKVGAQRRVVVEYQLQALGARSQFQRCAHLGAQRMQREVQRFQLHRAAFQLGGVQDVVEQAQQRVRRMPYRGQVPALLRFQWRVQQQVGEADDRIHRRADFMAHVGQEGGLGLGGGFGAGLGLAQVVFHALAPADVVADLEHLGRLAVGIEDRIERGADPQLLALLVEIAIFAADDLALAELFPQRRVGRQGPHFRHAEDAVVLADQFGFGIAGQVLEIAVGREDGAVHVVLDHQHGPADGSHRALELGVAQLGFGVVDDHAVDAAIGPCRRRHAAATLPQPAFAAVAVDQPVLDDVVGAVVECLADVAGNMLVVVRVDQLVEMDAPVDEVLRGVAGQRFHRVADVAHRPVGVVDAAEHHAGDVADQQPVLLFAGAQRALHRTLFAQVGDEADVQGFFRQVGLADGQPDRQHAAILADAFHVAADADDPGLAGLLVAGQVAVVLRAVGFGHQHLDVAADQLLPGPAEQPLDGGVGGTDGAVGVDGEDAVHGGVQHRPHPGLVAPHLGVQGAVAQQAVGKGDGQHDDHGHQGGRQRQLGPHRGTGRVLHRGRADEARRSHAGVVHAADRQAHDRAAGQRCAAAEEARLHVEACPQRQAGQRHGHHDRQPEQPRVVAQQRCHPHGGHARVMHHADAGTDEHAAQHQHARGDPRPRDQGQRPPRGQHGRHDRKRGGERRIGHRHAQVEGQHADEMHRPDAATQCQRTGQAGQPPVPRVAADVRHADDVHGHRRSEHRHRQRQQHQPGVVMADQQHRSVVVGGADETGEQVGHGGANTGVGPSPGPAGGRRHQANAVVSAA